MFVNVTCYVLFVNVTCYVLFVNVTCFVLFVNISCSFLFVIVIFSSFLFGCHGYFEVEIDDDVTSQI
jgi:hypothetical protein